MGVRTRVWLAALVLVGLASALPPRERRSAAMRHRLGAAAFGEGGGSRSVSTIVNPGLLHGSSAALKRFSHPMRYFANLRAEQDKDRIDRLASPAFGFLGGES